MTSLGVVEMAESDSSEDEWVITSTIVPTTTNTTSTKALTKKPPAHKRPTISPASIRTIRANLPRNLLKAPNSAPSVKVHSQSLPTSPAPTPLTPPTATTSVVSMQYISDTELEVICSEMDAQLLVTRLVQVYKSCEIYVRIREIETTNSQIEMRLKDHLHYCSDPPDFILDTLASLSNYFADNSKNKDLTGKFRRFLAQNLCTALAKYLDTPIDKRQIRGKITKLPEQQQHQEEEEADLITFEVDLISFDDDDNGAIKQNTTLTPAKDDDDKEEDHKEVDDEEDDDKDEYSDSSSSSEDEITFAQLIGVPDEIIDRYTLTLVHQLKLIDMTTSIPSPVVVYYAMDVFQLVTIIGHGCQEEDQGVFLCKTLLKHSYYDEAVHCIRKLDLFTRFPVDQTADQFFTAGHGMYLATLYAERHEEQKHLLDYINRQLRFNYAGNLDVVPQQYLQDLFDGTDQTPQLTRLKERKFQKDLMNCGAKIMKEMNIESNEYYFIWLSQRYACLRFMLAQRTIQQLEDGDLSIEASANFNGLIDSVCENDPVLARLAIKELIDTGDTVAPPYFASRYKQQEFYCRYNALPLNQRLLGVVKGEQLSRHRTTFSSPKKGMTKRTMTPNRSGVNGEYKLPTRAQVVWVDSHSTLMLMKEILSVSNICGMDTEWIPGFAKVGSVKTALMQIATDIDGYIFLLDLKTMFESENAHLCRLTEIILRLLFEDDHILKLAYDFSGDLDLLHYSIPSSKEWTLTHLLDMKIIKTKQGETITGGLAGLVSTFLGVGLNKRQQLSNWELRPLSEKQIIYGACDAIVLLDIYNKLCQCDHSIIKNLPKFSV